MHQMVEKQYFNTIEKKKDIKYILILIDNPAIRQLRFSERITFTLTGVQDVKEISAKMNFANFAKKKLLMIIRWIFE